MEPFPARFCTGLLSFLLLVPIVAVAATADADHEGPLLGAMMTPTTVGASSSASLEPSERQNLISLVHGAFDPTVEPLAIPLAFRLPADRPTSHFIVQTSGPVADGWRSALLAQGRIAAYIPYNAYLMQLPSGPSSVAELEFVRAVIPYEPFYKLQPGLAETHGEICLLANLYPWSSGASLLATASALEARILSIERSEWQTTIELLAPSSALPGLAAIEEVRWLQRSVQPRFGNAQAQWVTQSGVQNNRPIWDKGLHGEKMVVGVGDSGLDWDHAFFRDPNMTTPGSGHRKVIGVKDWAIGQGDTNGHGTHVAGSVAGNDGPVGRTSVNDGQAPSALLYIDHISNGDSDWKAPKDHNILLQGSYDTNASGTGEGARLHSNSWGYTEGGGYDQAAMTNDQFAWSHKDFLPVWLAGNSRSNGANSIWTGGNSKNVITIGATQNGASQDAMATFSSLGPLNDGRMKPTVCTPGVSVVSADADSSLTSNNFGEAPGSGTSMATPTAAGNMALIRQYYKEGWYPTGKKTSADGFAPSASLMKATAAAGATEMKGAGTDYNNEGKFPNNSQGFGRMTLDRSLYFDGDASKLIAIDETANGLATGQKRSYDFEVKGTGQPFRAMLVWTDYPGALNANPQIVNDLDLEVTGPGGIYKGNNFQGKAPGHSVIGGSFDRLNVEEAVFLPDAANGLVAGKYTLTVAAQNVPQGPQPFAIVIVGDVDAVPAQTVAQVVLAPSSAQVEVTKSLSFQARALDAAGADVPGVVFLYSATPAGMGTVADLGSGKVDFTALTKAGPSTLQATAAGKSGSASITIVAGAPMKIETIDSITLQAGGRLSVIARVLDQHDNEIAAASVDWSMTGSVGGFTPASGLLVEFTAATKIGSGSFTARSGSATASGPITVIPGPPARIAVTPTSVEADPNTSQDLEAQLFDMYDNSITNGTLKWDAASIGVLDTTSGYRVRLTLTGLPGTAGDVVVTSGVATTTVPVKIKASSVGPGPGSGSGQAGLLATLFSFPWILILLALVAVAVGGLIFAVTRRRRKRDATSYAGPTPWPPALR